MLPETEPGRVDGPMAAPSAPAATRPRGSLAWWLIAAIIVLDQASKALVQHFVPVYGSVTVIPGLLDLVHIHNAGVAFGLMNDVDHPWRSTFTTGLALAALAGIVYYSRQMRPD